MRTEGGAMVLRRTTGVIATVVLMSLMGLLGVTGIVAGDGTFARVFGSVLVLAAVVAVTRALRYEVVADEMGLHVHGLMRTRDFEWAELRGADVVPGSIFARSWHLRIHREGAGPIRLPDLSQVARAKNVERLAISEMAKHIDWRVRSVGGRPID